MKRLSRSPENLSHFIDKNLPPVLFIDPGEIVEIETERADNLYTNSDPGFLDVERVKNLRVNPVTGPIYINGAGAGDLVTVKIHDILLGDDRGFTSFQPTEGIFASRFLETSLKSETMFFDLDKDRLEFSAKNGTTFYLDYEPMIGTIATAHPHEIIPTLYNNKRIMGNVDCTMVKKGSTVVLPVNVPGALLSLGDIHARQGSGEPAGTAAECRGIATVEINIVKKDEYGYFDWPQVNDDEYIGTIAFSRNSLHEAIQFASYDMVHRLISMTGLTFAEATIFIGLCQELEICQCTGGLATVCARIKRRYINQK